MFITNYVYQVAEEVMDYANCNKFSRRFFFFFGGGRERMEWVVLLIGEIMHDFSFSGWLSMVHDLKITTPYLEIKLTTYLQITNCISSL